MGNETLIDEGIFNDKSNFRIHVCPLVKRLYSYPTKCGINAINKGDYKKRSVTTNGIVTAEGYAVPFNKIYLCQEMRVPKEYWNQYAFIEKEKGGGGKAENFVLELTTKGWIRYASKATLVTNRQLQFDGCDINVSSNWMIQVKLDFKGGSRSLGGTGNLFVQTKECNPEKIYK